MSDENVQVELARLGAKVASLEAFKVVVIGRIAALEDIVLKREGAKAERLPAPEFNPNELLQHEWKGKNTGVRQWAPGSLAWGWDFTNQFPEEVIAVLQKGPLTIEGYVFTFNGKIVNVKKEG